MCQIRGELGRSRIPKKSRKKWLTAWLFSFTVEYKRHRCVAPTEKMMMQQLLQHITKLVAIATMVTGSKSWALNYDGIAQPRLVGDRFEPTAEVYPD
jgi:hypothetical protein